MQSPVEQIKARLDIAELVGGYVKLQRAGINLKALCPFHNEKTPSFFVSPARQSWHCFGCNLGGDVFSFIQQIEGAEFPEALRILAQRTGVELKYEPKAARDQKARLFEANELAAKFYAAQLAKGPMGARARAYLSERGLRDATIDAFRLGWAPLEQNATATFLRSRGFLGEEIERAGLSLGDRGHGVRDRFRGRIIFPIFDGSNRIVGFTGRIYGRDEGEYDPKYLNTPETPIFEKSRILYGLHAARKAIRKEGKAVFVEGQMDFLMAYQAGTEHAIAPSGTALTVQHLALIRHLVDTVIFAYDTDSAGVEAAKRGIELALEAGFLVRLAIVPFKKDPADFIKDDFGAWLTLLKSGTRPILGFLFEQALSVHDAATVEGKRAVAGALVPTLRRITNAVERSHWVSDIASRLHIREEALWEELARQSSAFAPAQKSHVSVGAPLLLSRRELLEEHLLALCVVHGAFPAGFEATLVVSPVSRELFRAVEPTLASAETALPQRLANLHASVGDAYRSRADRLAFAAEETAGAVRDIPLEIASCMRELGAINLRDRLDAISLEIEAAERAGDEARVRDLAERFREHSSHLSQLYATSS